MSKPPKNSKPKPRLPRGLRDIDGAAWAQELELITKIAKIYHGRGFAPLDTPALEYADALGSFLPDADRPNAGVFALEDDDGQWMSLRYDLTAPLARHVAEHYDRLPKPLRRYQYGPVWRNEKPGPGRFRQFTQIDADTVGASGMMADAEMCMMAADAMRALDLAAGDFAIRINNRKLLDGLLEVIGLAPDAEDYAARRLIILRAMDKLDRLGTDGVAALLGGGRKDESGDFTKGAELAPAAIEQIIGFVAAGEDGARRADILKSLANIADASAQARDGLDELAEMDALFSALGYGDEVISFSPAIVRGLGYYTGPVYEIDLGFTTQDATGAPIRFGAVGGGGRYDDLVKRFKGVAIPATGISIGVSRLAAALAARHSQTPEPLVIVLVMERARIAAYAQMVQELRAANIRAELYMGDSGMKAQLRYADQRGARLALIEGAAEVEKGEVTIKDLALGAEKSSEISDNAEWRAAAHAQITAARGDIIHKIKKILNISA